MMEIKKAVFVKSSSKTDQCPRPEKPEYAFIGRSNVGKSSLINMLCNQKDLARVSSTPGKTININHYLVDDKWYIVDLPGYGYAKRSKEMRAQWDEVMEQYFRDRPNLQSVFVLVDARLEPQEIDIDFINLLGEMEVPFSVVFTKTDKNNQGQTAKNVKLFSNELLKHWEELPVFFMTSAIAKKGKKEMLAFIHGINKSFVKPVY